LCHDALSKRGISVSDDLDIDLRWLDDRAGAIDAVHLHWPEYYWRRSPFSGLSRVRRGVLACERLMQLVRFVRAARRRGLQCIWTVHNLEPHEGSYRWDRYGYRLLARECDLVICHSRSAAGDVRHRYRPRGRVIVMPIGDPAGVYPPARPRTEVLAALRLDSQRPVVSCFGWLREYKGLDLACAAIERLNGRVQLIVAGGRHPDFEVGSLLATIARLPGAVLIDRQLSDQEFADLTAASDAVLLPYRAITGSSALLAALGFGRGVVTSDLPYFREILADEPDAGVTVGCWDPTAWAHAILDYLERPGDARNGAARRLAARYSWDRCIESLVAALGVHDDAGVARMQTVGSAS
jgi:glycosyltransferase involved in cell wall biosynthesis